MSDAAAGDAASFYDALLVHKLKDFVEGNERIERAWETVEAWAPLTPRHILEVGCAVGATCWRMKRRWPDAEVTGLDLSPRFIEVARRLFGGPNLSFHLGSLAPGAMDGTFDLIVLMDVYEHIAAAERETVHRALRSLLAPRGRIVLSFPTPRHQAWLRQLHPEQLQPVDEDIDLKVLNELRGATETEVLLYQEVSVWRQGDYAHAVLGRWQNMAELVPSAAAGVGWRDRLLRRLAPRDASSWPARAQRLSHVRRRLGENGCPQVGA